MKIRTASSDDLPALDRIMRSAFEASYAGFMPPAYVEKRRQRLKSPDNVRKLLPDTGVAEINGVPIGCIACEDGFVAELWVDPASHRQGAGRALMQWAEERMRTHGCKKVGLHCYERNEDALRFYDALGYVVTNKFPSENVPGGPVTVCLLEKELKDGGTP